MDGRVHDIPAPRGAEYRGRAIPPNLLKPVSLPVENYQSDLRLSRHVWATSLSKQDALR